MKRLLFLVLLLSLFERSVQDVDPKPQRQDDVEDTENEEHDKYLVQTENTELKELRDMVTEQHLMMQTLKDKLNEQAAALNELQQQKSDQETLRNEVQQLKSDQEALRSKLQRDTSEPETVMENSALNSQLTALESRMVQMEKTLEDNVKQTNVAFSVGLTYAGQVGPYTGVRTLAYNKIFCNVGLAYNPADGVFTAPTRGVYYFTFTGYNNKDYPSAISMYRNSSRVRHLTSPRSQVAYFSNAITIQMEKGDHVYMQLPAHHTLYDDANHSCTLTGFLLFAL